MTTQKVLLERDGGVATVTLNRPDKMNALDLELMSELPRMLEQLATDTSVRCVVLTGAGEKAFSAGGDISDMSSDNFFGGREAGGDPGRKEPWETAATQLRRAMEASAWLHEMGKPTLASVNGATAGASLAMALACDLRIAADHAVFTTAFAKIGYSGDFGGAWYLTKIVGTAKARELYFLSDRIDAQEAHRLGLVNWVVPREKLRDETRVLAQRLAAGPPLAYRYMKRNLNLALTAHERELLDLESEAMMRTGATQDFRNAAAAFLAKKTPSFEGR
jgi:2-(1,2-epoxy-1,2-dihydrophenyl)acetyl-CoA isomerase